MNYERFAESIELIKQNLISQISEKEKNSQDLILKINKSLFEDKEYALVFLKSLEDKLEENSQSKINQIKQLEQDIDSLKLKLEKDITSYNKKHVLDDDKARLFSIKEEKLVEPRAKRKREIQELNQKITLLDKECLQILKENDQALNEEEKNFKVKLQDLERKMKLEVNRIAEAILTPIIKDSSEADQEAQIQKNKQIITEERKKGINEMARIKLKYYNDMRQIEIAFSNYKHNLKRERGIKREEYDQRIEELVYIRKTLQNDLQKQTDMYDFDVYQNLNALEKEYSLGQNDLKKLSAEKVEQKQTEIFTTQKLKSGTWHQDASGIFDYVEETDTSLNLILGKIILEEQELMHNLLSKTNENLLENIESFKLLTINLIKRFWDIKNIYEKSLHSAFVYLNHKFASIEDYEKTLMLQELEVLLNDYNSRQKQYHEDFVRQVSENYKVLVKQANTIYTNNVDFVNNEVNHINNHITSLNNWTKKVHDKAGVFLKQELDKKNKDLNLLKQKSNEARRKELESLTGQDRKIEEDYYSKTYNLNKKISEYHSSKRQEEIKLKQEHEETLSKSKANILRFKNEYKKDLSKDLSLIAHKYNSLVKEAELERKTKLRMGQI